MELNKQYSEAAMNLLNEIHGGILKSKNGIPEDVQGIHLDIDLNVFGLAQIEFDLLVSNAGNEIFGEKEGESERVKNKLIETMVAMSRYLVDNYNF